MSLTRPLGASLNVGCIHRTDIAEFMPAAKSPLRELLQHHRIDKPVQVICLASWGEIASNFYRHTTASVLRYSFRAEAGRVSMTAIYPTTRFDVNPPPPALYSQSGYGIMLIRALTESTWIWNGGVLHVTMTVPFQSSSALRRGRM